ncbi:DUF572-domain-containing protein [Eremomyces bilateralis CBS 781.70]|uniref:DUF572-domain-containing protein n=1 Tax=Eremomyces bilateralis CBS 781.70 TaxID=1392243 RepID=A0A6G1FVE2_9PEZI|nr:DUF572-domain-containing protein [Eremomyces bilateralis CBS 781.70]KAF1809787.1 DUF572-domain-containing protein [Eremomyces bilateralis CBS 781.70]
MQGFNMGRYYPPDATDAPKFNQTSHPLGARARKINQGILTVRFELPFAIWCEHCTPPAIIAQGVRFNAEKKKVGNYYTTPIWSFRIKHGACGGGIELRTDPKNAEYVVAEGAKRRDYGEGKEEDKWGKFGEVLTEEERERRRTDAFARLEGKKADEGRAEPERERVEELVNVRERDWDDPYEANKRVRRQFRAERKVRQQNERETEALQQRIGWDGEILELTAEDKTRAELVDFGERGSIEDDISRVSSRPMLTKETNRVHSTTTVSKLRTKASIAKEEQAARFQQQLQHNTRAALNPFALSAGDKRASIPPTIAGIKRRDRSSDTDGHPRLAKAVSIVKDAPITAPDELLVKSKPDLGLTGYDSDD